MQSIPVTDDLRETTQNGTPDFPLKYYLDDMRHYYQNEINWHWHQEFELVLVTEGKVICQADRECFSLAAGEAVFINSSVLHRFTSENALMPNIVFSSSFLAAEQSLIYKKYVAPVKESAFPCVVFREGVGWQEQAIRLLTALFDQWKEEAVEELKVRNLLSEFWLLMGREISFAEARRERGAGQDLSYCSVPVMIQFIRSHYAQEIRLKDVAAAANISENTALRYFRQQIGCSPMDYLIRYRISQACRLLRETSQKIVQISAAVGYENTSYFCRLFKKEVGLSPKEYRRL